GRLIGDADPELDRAGEHVQGGELGGVVGLDEVGALAGARGGLRAPAREGGDQAVLVRRDAGQRRVGPDAALGQRAVDARVVAGRADALARVRAGVLAEPGAGGAGPVVEGAVTDRRHA